MESYLIGLAVSVLMLWLGSMEVRFRNMDARLREAPSREEVADELKQTKVLIETKMQIQDVKLDSVKELLERIEAKLSRS